MSKHSHRVARSVPPSRSGGSFLLGMFVGVIIGLGVALGVAFYLNKTPLPFIDKSKSAAAKDGKDASAEPAKQPAIAGMPQSAAKGGEASKPRFDFYKILPGSEEPVSDKELKDAAKAAKGQPESAKGVYFIQAGSFQNPADADNQKAKIAILGFESGVEPTTLPDKGTWYRVRLGPYSTLEELNQVRRTLSQNGIDASLVKLRDIAAKDTQGKN